jgi:gamma-glutamyltranspeptidase/glutathione hydrolase
MSLLKNLIACCLCCLLAAPFTRANEHQVTAKHGVVVSVSEPASNVGLAILKQGGNAIDAAVATALALAVTHPAAGNIGGGGYLLVAPPQGEPLVFDFREVAPAAATRDMFVDPTQRTPHRRVGVPGTVRGLADAHARLGKLPWRELVQPAIKLAAEGFPLEASTARTLNKLLADSPSMTFPELHRVFGRPDGKPLQAGEVLKQPDLARTLTALAAGAEGFYAGPVAELLVAEMERGRGLITAADLAAYRCLVHPPLRGTYRGYELLVVPPSSSGGTTLLESLNMLETHAELPPWGSVEQVHLFAEVMKRAYRDRARYLGDPLATKIPPELTDKAHAQKLAASITPRATPSRDLAGDISITNESEQTTHFSVVDAERLAVSLTYTLENSYGSRVVVTGAGFLLNDEMNDFNWLPGVTNTAGRIGTEANLVRPGRRMLSSMCPTIVQKDGRTVLVTGSPGGRTIINTVLGVLTNVIDYKMPLPEAVAARRMHQAWFPDAIQLEPAWAKADPGLLKDLAARGHKLAEMRTQGDAHSIGIDWEKGTLQGVADRRLEGHAAGW